jgi:S-formylglutathione hydrolase FrmB
MDPANGNWRLARIEGIATDGISAVGVVDAEGALHTTPVVGNVYKMASSDFPASSPCPGFEARAIVALDANGSVVFTKSLGAS